MWKGDEVQSIPDPKVLETNVFKTEIPPNVQTYTEGGAKGNVKLIWTLSKLKQVVLQCSLPYLAPTICCNLSQDSVHLSHTILS